ncbi:hypothetical protein K505DRAFT_374492 [Melanomma pulvis-pyrius CBS 109.77]|uniref:Uncharacterized protein n=1 Tax=Melanomma pulvis-pyrius CBS 109.77 TaxID=1314802 RepID=A0A6A6XE93_9PLEO|nr:hypothetical protein K505DRAFT_374492 [Melanomma pulvis-pyrius CBS 109.77]
MANPAADAKSALLAEELREFALALPTTLFPKGFFCTTCHALAFDSWKLICCNKAVCSSCHEKLAFPTTCPSCDHTPLEAESCVPNKALRNTMRVWLQKQRKKEDAKATPKATTPPADVVLEATVAQAAGDAADRPVESIEKATRPEDFADNDATIAGDDGETAQRAGSTAAQPNENSLAPQTGDTQPRGSPQSQNANASAEPTSATQDRSTVQSAVDGSIEGAAGKSTIMNANGMAGQFGFGFTPNQGNFNGMGWNGMTPMNGMANMMPNGNWSNMNPMDFNMMNHMNGMSNMPNGMYNGFGGNMGMAGMNDMSAMNMMNFGGGYGNWGQDANGAGYGNFNGYNQMGGYNQSGAQYPEMMNQFPKNNFSTQNRFHANGAAFPQQRNNRNGSLGYGNQNNGSGPGFPHRADSRPGSRGGPPHNCDGEIPDGKAEAATEAKIKNEHAQSSAEPTQEGKGKAEDNLESTSTPNVHAEGASSTEVTEDPNELTRAVRDESNSAPQTNGLNPIQTVDSVEMDPSAAYDESMMIDPMHPDQAYGQGMVNNYSNQTSHMIGPYDANMGYNQNNYGSRGGFNAAYGAATVLVGEPRGLGVEGAPTGPRAMREGRPNTGFSSRANNPRSISNAPVANAPPTQEAAPSSPLRRGRSSPERDETLRTKNKSPTRSRSRSRDDDGDVHVERARSVEDEEKRKHGDRAATPAAGDGHDRRNEGRQHRSSRHDDRDERDVRDSDYDDRYRDDRDNREGRARSTSADSKHRSRRDKEKHRSSRSHRDRSREHRRRHRSRSRSPIAEEGRVDHDAHSNGTDVEIGARRKNRSEKEKHRERDSDRSRDKDRDRDRRERRDRRDRDYDRDHDYDREKDRSREKDRDRKRSRRDREGEAEEERDYNDEKYRSSRRNRKERDRDRDRDHDKEPTSATSTRPVSPPVNAPTGPSADGFSIRGVSKSKKEDRFTTKPMPPPTGPRSFQPPKGPAADRDKNRRDSREHRRKSSVTSVPTTPTTPSAQDHYAAEREKNARERDRLDRDKTLHSVHSRATSSRSNSISVTKDLPTTSSTSTSKPLSTKRSRDAIDDDGPATTANDSAKSSIPTGPASHRTKRRKSDINSDNVANLFAAGLRKHAGARERRRGGVKNEGSVERELERTERERDGRRW